MAIFYYFAIDFDCFVDMMLHGLSCHLANDSDESRHERSSHTADDSDVDIADFGVGGVGEAVVAANDFDPVDAVDKIHIDSMEEVVGVADNSDFVADSDSCLQTTVVERSDRIVELVGTLADAPWDIVAGIA